MGENTDIKLREMLSWLNEEERNRLEEIIPTYSREVKSEFELGQWVAIREEEEVGVLHKFRDDETSVLVDLIGRDKYRVTSESNLREASDYEVQYAKSNNWFSKHGRLNWELRKGDILVTKEEEEENEKFYSVRYINERHVYVSNGSVYPKNSFIEGKSGFRVACFSRERKDIGDYKIEDKKQKLE